MPAKSTQLPRHLILREQLLDDWRHQRLERGDPIPSQSRIVESCEFSLATVVKVLKDMEYDDIIERKVGVGSFIKQPPWEKGHFRIGFYYDRSYIGGSVLNNEFYGGLLRQIENAVLADKHEFVYGSFEPGHLPEDDWKALDALIITSIEQPMQTDWLPVPSVVVQLDVLGESARADLYYLDVGRAFDRIVRFAATNELNRILYVNNLNSSPMSDERFAQFERAMSELHPDGRFDSIRCDVEHDTEGDDFLNAVTDNSPDLVMGYIRTEWKSRVLNHLDEPISIFHYNSTDTEGDIIRIDYAKWAETVWARIKARLDDSSIVPSCFAFEAE